MASPPLRTRLEAHCRELTARAAAARRELSACEDDLGVFLEQLEQSQPPALATHERDALRAVARPSRRALSKASAAFDDALRAPPTPAPAPAPAPGEVALRDAAEAVRGWATKSSDAARGAWESIGATLAPPELFGDDATDDGRAVPPARRRPSFNPARAPPPPQHVPPPQSHQGAAKRATPPSAAERRPPPPPPLAPGVFVEHTAADGARRTAVVVEVGGGSAMLILMVMMVLDRVDGARMEWCTMANTRAPSLHSSPTGGRGHSSHREMGSSAPSRRMSAP